MKKCLSLILAVIMAFSVLSVASFAATRKVVATGSCADTTKPGTAVWTLYSDEVLEISGTGYIDAKQPWYEYDDEGNYYYIEKIVVNEGIVGINANAFYRMDCEITLPSTVVEIGEMALCYNSAEKFIIPSALKTANGASFAGFEATEYELDESNSSFCVKDGVLYSKDAKTLVSFPMDSLYVDEKTVENYKVPDFVEKIDDYAFFGVAVKELVIPGNIETIGEFSFCASGIDSLVIEAGVKNIGASAFAGSYIVDASLPDTLETIGELAFSDSELMGIYLPGKATVIGTNAIGTSIYVDIAGLMEALLSSEVEIDFENIDFDKLDPEELLKQLNINPDDYIYYTAIPGFVIYGTKGSTAEQYAAANKIEFVETEMKPAILQYVGVNKDGVVEIGWQPTSEATGYKLYRKQNNDTKWTMIADITDATVRKYKDTAATEGNKYYYTVKAYNATTEAGFGKTGLSVLLLKEPVIKSIKNIGKGISFTWDKCEYANSYIIYRKSIAYGWEIYDITDTNSYVDEEVSNGKLYSYCVQASTLGEDDDFTSLFTESSESAYGNHTAKYRYVSSPKVSKLTNTERGMKIEWNKISGATGHVVYRKDAQNGWKEVGKTTDGSKVSCFDSTVKSGTTYTYTVRALNGDYKSSYYSGKSALALTAPKITSIKNTGSGAVINWSKVSGAKGYYVYRKTSSDSGWTRIGNVKSGSTVSFKDTTAKSGVTYQYTVKAYNGSTLGAHSTTGKTNVFLSAPKLVSAKSASNGIKLTYGKVSAASNYTIYRKTANSGWSKIATVKGSSTVAFTDKTAKKGTTYTYTVRAVKGNYISSYYPGIKGKR